MSEAPLSSLRLAGQQVCAHQVVCPDYVHPRDLTTVLGLLLLRPYGCCCLRAAANAEEEEEQAYATRASAHFVLSLFVCKPVGMLVEHPLTLRCETLVFTVLGVLSLKLPDQITSFRGFRVHSDECI